MKKSNYISPEVVMVEFELERGFQGSMKVGDVPTVKQGTQTFTHDNSTDDNWSSIIPSSTPISGN